MATNYEEGLSRIQPHTWKIAFIFAFLALLVDGADLMLLSYSLNSIKADFGLSSVQAGMLGSFTLAGMAVGGIFGGWACDKFGQPCPAHGFLITAAAATIFKGLAASLPPST